MPSVVRGWEWEASIYLAFFVPSAGNFILFLAFYILSFEEQAFNVKPRCKWRPNMESYHKVPAEVEAEDQLIGEEYKSEEDKWQRLIPANHTK